MMARHVLELTDWCDFPLQQEEMGTAGYEDEDCGMNFQVGRGMGAEPVKGQMGTGKVLKGPQPPRLQGVDAEAGVVMEGAVLQ